MKKHPQFLFPFSLLILMFLQFISAIEFIFNGFNPTSVSLYGNATIKSRFLTLTNDTTFSMGRGLYPSRIITKNPNSSEVLPFSTSFIFAMAPFKNKLPGHGIVFLFVPFNGIQGASSAQNLGFLNRTNDGNPNNHIFGIEFDVFKNQEFNDINANHVGIDVNSLTSISSNPAGYWVDNDTPFKEVVINNGKNYQVWIDYKDSSLNVTMAPVGIHRPKRPLLSVSINLSQVFVDEMFVGFTAATGALVESHKILSWSFSTSNFSLWQALVTRDLPSFELPKESIVQSKWFISGITVGGVFVVVICSVVVVLLIKRKRKRVKMEEWELEYWPHRIPYQEIEAATKGFSFDNVIGIGGNGKVYKGLLAGGTEIAVKRFSHENNEGVREFLAEISSLGRLRHRNLVALRGWCKKEKGSLILVYDYMENGSLDKRVFVCQENEMLSYEERIRVLKDVASGVLYLHEGWESKVLHRDIKASNVLLDKEMNGRLGDFGLARMHEHGRTASTTRVVGTAGYLAPEVVRAGRASTQADVFGFGVLMLEVMCGRRPIEEGKPLLVEWVWDLMERGELVNALDPRLWDKGGYHEEDVERVLNLGLLCAYPEAQARPTMRQVVKFLEGTNEVEESGEENEMYLIKNMSSKEFWSNFFRSFNYGSLTHSHPTFEEIREGRMSSSMSLSSSDVIREGSSVLGNESEGVDQSDVPK